MMLYSIPNNGLLETKVFQLIVTFIIGGIVKNDLNKLLTY